MKTPNGALASTASACLKKAIDSLPNLSPRPAYAIDHTGKRRGKMTAIAWYRPSHSGKGALWLCRCECGSFEYRRPGTWQSKPHPDDMCDACLRAKGPNARQTAQVRFQRWTESLRNLGLTENEITQIQTLNIDVKIKGNTAAEVRKQIAKAELMN